MGTVAMAGTASAATDTTNVVTNGGFESGDLSGWTCTGSTGEVVDSPVRSGSYALAATPAGADNARCSQTVDVQPDSTYSMSAWVRGSYVYLGATGTGTSDTSTWGSSQGWKTMTTTFTTGADTDHTTVYVHGWYGQPAFHVDDVSVIGPPGDGGGQEQPPAAPGNLAVTGTTETTVSLSWSGVSDANGYNVYSGDDRVATGIGGHSYTVTGLTPDTGYTFTVTATNSAGESPHSNSGPATTDSTDGGGGAALPDHVLTGYWQDFVNGATPLRLSDVPESYDLVAVAFALKDRGERGAVTFGVDPDLSDALDGYTDADFKADIDTLHARGQKVILSVGGAKGSVPIDSAAAATSFADSIDALMDEYGFDGVDIDLEHGISPTYTAQALHQIAADNGPDTIITMAPQTINMQSTARSYFQLALNVKDILTIINMQYYNSGSMNGCDRGVYAEGTEDFLTALACIQLKSALDPSQIGLGLPASGRAAGGGYQSPGTVNDALDCLATGTNCGGFAPQQTWPGIRGAMDWSINWDASNGYQFANTIAPHLDTLP